MITWMLASALVVTYLLSAQDAFVNEARTWIVVHNLMGKKEPPTLKLIGLALLWPARSLERAVRLVRAVLIARRESLAFKAENKKAD